MNGSPLFLEGRRRWLPLGTVGDSLPWTGEGSPPVSHVDTLLPSLSSHLSSSPQSLSSSSLSFISLYFSSHLSFFSLSSHLSSSPRSLSSSSLSFISLYFSSHLSFVSLSFTPLFLYPSRLLAHAHDPDLDKNTSREFIVYACPSGALGTQIEDFMETTLYQFGRNGSHKSIPHVTLCQFFKV